jgi:hypothetical protein
LTLQVKLLKKKRQRLHGQFQVRYHVVVNTRSCVKMAEQANMIIEQLQAEVLALQEAAAAKAVVVAEVAAAAVVIAEAAIAAATLAAVAPPGGARGGPPAGRAPPGAPPGGAPHPPGPVLALAPALANTANFLDLTTANGAKLFKSAADPLGPQPFDFSDDSDLPVFLDLVLTRAQVCGWCHIFNVPVTNAETGTTLNRRGSVPLLAVRKDALTCCTTPSNRAQDLFMAC